MISFQFTRDGFGNKSAFRGGVREVPFGVMLVPKACCSKFTEGIWRKGALRHCFTINTKFKKEPKIKSNYD